MRLLPNPAGRVMRLLFVSLGISMSITAQDSLRVDSMVLSNRNGLENILQGSVAGLRVKQWSGTPGTQSLLNLRGLSLDPTDQSTMPLILVNGIPIVGGPSDVTGINPLGYFSPEQVERIEVIKNIDQLAAYGVLAANGAINIIMKEGQEGSIHVRGSASAGFNFLQNMDYRKDAFYNFNTLGRREVYGNGGMVHEQNVLIDGAGSYGSYLFGLTNHQDKGIIKGSGTGRQSLFLNAKYNISDKLSAHFYNNLVLASRDGRYAGEYSRDLTLPVVADESFFMDKNRNLGLISSMKLSYQFSQGLSLNTVAGISYEGASRDMYVPSNVLDGEISASSIAYKRQLINWNTYVNWLKSLSDAIQMDMTIGGELRDTDNRLTSVSGRRNMENGGSNFVKVVTGYNANQLDALSNYQKEKIVSFYGNWKFKYKKDLDVNLVLRTDGSSLYQDKWALYPALGARYDLKNSTSLPLRLNASVGRTGILSRPEIYRGQLAEYGDYYGGNFLGVGHLYPAYPDAKSIAVTQIDAGIAFDLIPQLTISVDYFNKTYRDFTYQRYLPNISGIDYQYETGGAIGLSGVEVNVDANVVSSGRFSWISNFNIAFYKNKVKELPTDLSNTSLSYLGVLGKNDAVTSLLVYQNGQQKVIGNSDPKAFGGFTNKFKYGNFALGFVLSYAWGADIAASSFSSRYLAEQVGNQYPTKTGETPYYTIGQSEDGRTIYQGIRTIEDGAFIRLSRAYVSYDLKSAIKKSAELTAMEVFVRGDNLFTLSRYSGINPEENFTGTRMQDLRYTGTPLPTSVALGVKLIF